MKETVHFIITGGTIDSYYEGSKDTVVTNEKSVIPQFIKSLKLYSECAFTVVCMKDSRESAMKDLQAVYEQIRKSPHKRIIITHGTYTMPDTGRFLKERLKGTEKTIVLTGSMIPLSGFSPSDAPFNIGFAFAKVHELPHGVYVCMHGRVFSPDEVMKVLKEGRFSSIVGES
ncbi:MAG: asparaginase [Candidatus Aenigmarchaeota archaeon]|nr:asparaginase [Candidatus Aenigmarchaeota archaeon]